MTDTKQQETVNIIAEQVPAVAAVPAIYPSLGSAITDAGVLGLGKDSTNQHHKFNYRSIDDAMEMANKILSKNHLAIHTTSELVSNTTQTDQYGKTVYLQSYEFTFTVISTVDGSTLLPTKAQITNPSKDPSKNFGICQSYLYKEFIFKLFCIPVKGAEDLDSRDEAGVPKSFIPAVEKNTSGIAWEQKPRGKEQVIVWAAKMIGGTVDDANTLMENTQPNPQGKKAVNFAANVRSAWEKN